jgi:hypothetical protein
MQNRRQHRRTPTTKAAELQFVNQAERYDCLIIDESKGGMQIYFDEYVDLPEELTIRFGEVAQRVRCRWSMSTRAGLEFIQPAF